MGKVYLKSVLAEGFGSIIDSTSFQLDRGGIWFVRGLNGTGKTTLFSALAWCLYKVNLKGLNNDKVPTWLRLRDNTFRGTRVVVEFQTDDTDYMVARHIKFKGTTRGLQGDSGLMIFSKSSDEDRPFTQEDLLGEAHYKEDQQAYLNKVLGVDSQVFLSSVLFGQKMKRLIEADNADKRKLFENLFELDFIAVMRKKATEDYNEKDAAVRVMANSLSSKGDELQTAKDTLTSQTKLAEDLQTKHDDRVKSAKDSLDLAVTDFKDATVLLQEGIELADKYDEQGITKLKADIEKEKGKRIDTKDAISDLKTTFQETVNKKYDTKQRNLQKQIDDLKDTKDKAIEKREEEVTAAKKKYDDKIALFNQQDQSYKDYNSSFFDFDREIKATDSKINALKTNLSELSTVCPTCEQNIPDKKLKAAKDNIEKSIKTEGLVLVELKKSQDDVKEKRLFLNR